MSSSKQEFPLFTATQSLTVNYTFKPEETEIELPAADIHAQLYAGYKGLLSTREEMKTLKTKKALYKSSVSSINFATVALTGLFTDTTPEEGYLGEDIECQTLHLTVPYKSDRILGVNDLYGHTDQQYNQPKVTKSVRDHDFNRMLKHRVHCYHEYSADSYYYPKGTCVTVAQIDTAIKGEMFHEHFHHSEQTAMHYLSDTDGIKCVSKWLARECGAQYVYGVVADIFTQRMMCGNCNVSLLGMQLSHEGGFIADLSQDLLRRGVDTRPHDGLMFNARVSAIQSGGRRGNIRGVLDITDDKGVVHDYDPDQDNWILQANNPSLGTKSIINKEQYGLDSYKGTFFVSSSFGKARLEEKIKRDLDIDTEETEEAAVYRV